MTTRHWIATSALLAMLAVSAGAFGAHALSDHLTPERLATFRLGARYQLLHALALLVTTSLSDHLDLSWQGRSRWAFLLGIFVFSGSLYLLVLTDTPRWGAITPIGGVLLHLGWIFLAMGALRKR